MDLRVGHENSEKMKGGGAFLEFYFIFFYMVGCKEKFKDVCIYLLPVFLFTCYF